MLLNTFIRKRIWINRLVTIIFLPLARVQFTSGITLQILFYIYIFCSQDFTIHSGSGHDKHKILNTHVLQVKKWYVEGTHTKAVGGGGFKTDIMTGLYIIGISVNIPEKRYSVKASTCKI